MSPKEESKLKQKLTPLQYRVLRQKETEAPFSGKYFATHEPGVYVCAACGAELFKSDDQFDSGTGWPSFFAAAAGDRIELRPDHSYGMNRTEVICANCGSHLGHLFNDGPVDHGGQRYCINSSALDLKPKE